jgi:transcription-repair coupling factor (superfamily II helicase)
MTEGATQRLEALQDFSTLGSGYSLAFRDLQIRGAGELLGAKQHGPMANVGFEMYSDLIKEAVEEIRFEEEERLRGNRQPAKAAKVDTLRPLPLVDLPVEAFLPETYVPVQAQRLYYYKQLMASRTPEELLDVRDAMVDRYGTLPLPAQRVLDIMDFRMHLAEMGIQAIEYKSNRLRIRFESIESVPSRVIRSVLSKFQASAIVKNELVLVTAQEPLALSRRIVSLLGEAIVDHEASLQRLGI